MSPLRLIGRTTLYCQTRSWNVLRCYAQKAQARPLPPIDEADIEETFVRGSGPGGQAINKTNISVSLIHKPTGIRVQCHQTRSLVWNQSLARKILRERVDLALNPGSSKLEAKWSKEAAKKAAQARKRRRKKRGSEVTKEKSAGSTIGTSAEIAEQDDSDDNGTKEM